MSSKSVKNIVGEVVKTVDGDYAFTDENEVIKVSDKPKRQRRPDPMPYKVYSVELTPGFKVYALIGNKIVLNTWSRNSATGEKSFYEPADKFSGIIESLFTGRGTKQYIIAQFQNIDGINLPELF